MSTDCQDQRVEDLRVLYDFEYQTKDDRTITISEGEKLFLIAKTNADWWQVIRSSRERPFFVPAQYVEAADDGQRILSDRRKSWAVEELLLELTRRHPQPEPEPDYDVETDNDSAVLSRRGDKITGAAISADESAKTEGSVRARVDSQPRYNRVSVHLACVNDVNGNPEAFDVDDVTTRAKAPNQANNRGLKSSDGNQNVSSGKSATVRVQPSVSSVSSVSSESLSVRSPRSRVSVHLERIGGGESGLTEFRANRERDETSGTESASNGTPTSEAATPEICASEVSDQSGAPDFATKGTELRSNVGDSQPASPEVFTKDSPFHLAASEINRIPSEIIPVDADFASKAEPNLTFNTELSRKEEPSPTSTTDQLPTPTVSTNGVHSQSRAADTVPLHRHSSGSQSKGSYARVSISPEAPRPSRRGPKVTQLSESLERLAQQIQFGGAPSEAPSPSEAPPMFPDARQRLTHSRSFKGSREPKPVAAPRQVAIGFRNPAFHRSADDLLALPSEDSLALPAVTSQRQGPLSDPSAPNTGPKEVTSLPSRWDRVRGAMRQGGLVQTVESEESAANGESGTKGDSVAPRDNSLVPNVGLKSDSLAPNLGLKSDLLAPNVGLKEDTPRPVSGTAPVEHVAARFSASSGSRSSLDELVSAFEARSRSGSNTSDDAVLEPRKAKTSLTRANRVQQLYKNVRECEEGGQGEGEGECVPVPVPAGWTQSLDKDSGLPCFQHPATGDKWFSSSDAEGRVYFFEENSPNSSWALPALTPPSQTPPSPPAKPQRTTLGVGRTDSVERKGSYRGKDKEDTKDRKDSYRNISAESSKDHRKDSYREINSKGNSFKYVATDSSKDHSSERKDSYKFVTKDRDKENAKESFRERKDSEKERKKESKKHSSKERDRSKENTKESRKESLREIKEAAKKDKEEVKERVVISGKPSMASIASLLLAERRAGGGASNRAAKTMSMILPSTSFPEEKSPTGAPPAWPQLFDNNTMRVVRQGSLQRARVLDLGRKVRKTWGPAYAVLTELLLLFFPDQKQATALLSGPPSASTAPELVVALSGATVSRCDRSATSRKHALCVSAAMDACDVLLQLESHHAAECWEHDLRTVVQLLPHSEPAPVQSPSVGKKSSAKVQRSKSMKLKGAGPLAAAGSVEDLSAPGASAADSEDRHRIRARLRKFFVRRPTREALVKKGIYKDEPMFGRLLSDVMSPGQPAPAFVVRCVDRIESRRDNMEADGLYRVSGNLSQVQRIRLAADQNDLGPLDSEEDVHVVTGALKLFFRELKQPLIPCQLYVQSLKACSEPSKAERLRLFSAVVRALPPANRSTLRYLLAHLLRVSAGATSNRMHVANIAIVFGPTLMWSTDAASTHMATELMQQNLVVEHLLLNYDTLF